MKIISVDSLRENSPGVVRQMGDRPGLGPMPVIFDDTPIVLPTLYASLFPVVELRGYVESSREPVKS